jgi:hypothetical protein
MNPVRLVPLLQPYQNLFQDVVVSFELSQQTAIEFQAILPVLAPMPLGVIEDFRFLRFHRR